MDLIAWEDVRRIELAHDHVAIFGIPTASTLLIELISRRLNTWNSTSHELQTELTKYSLT